MKKIAYKSFIILMLSAVVFSSCDDWFDLRPQSETILEDYWTDKNDVLSALSACYRGLNDPSVMERLIVWGEVRSDNVIGGARAQDNRELEDILTLKLNASNGYSSWGDFYKIINYCNNVIHFAPEVRKKDPVNFSEREMQSYIAEAKGIRALCYFVLVRTFKNVPFVKEPVIDDTESFELSSTDPDELLAFLVEDLKSIENVAPLTWENNLRYSKGRITRAAIYALIADISLWLKDYQTCVEYCDRILYPTDSNAPVFSLASGLQHHTEVFIMGNSDESIFELQFNAGNIANYVAFEMYQYLVSGSGLGRSGTVFQLSAANFNLRNSFFATTDVRATESFIPIETNGYYPILKYVGARINNLSTVPDIRDYSSVATNYINWIFYRLPDIYLMQAEALVELNGAASRDKIIELVKYTYARSNLMDINSAELDGYFAAYNDVASLRNLVFDERQREFLFEGKRYYDLVRRAERENNAENIVRQYLLNKYASSNLNTVLSKTGTINALYMPINRDEVRLHGGKLEQNPFYKEPEGNE